MCVVSRSQNAAPCRSIVYAKIVHMTPITDYKRKSSPHGSHANRVYVAALLIALATSAAAARKDSTAADEARPTLYEQAIGHMHEGDFDVAVIHLKNVLQQQPEHIPARILLGEAYLRQGRGSAAEKELRIALARGADEKHIYTPLGNALLMQRKYAEILRDLHSGRPGQADNVEVFTLRGRAHYELDQLDEAARDFERARRLSDQEVNPLLGLALVAAARAEWDSALTFVSQALDLEPDNPEAWFQRAEILRGTGDHAEAMAAYGHAIKLRPKHMRARIGRASLALFLGELAIARDDAAFVSEESPDNVTSAFLLWQVHLRLGAAEEAYAAFQKTAGRIASLTDEAIATEPSLLRIAGLIALAKREFERANRYLTLLVGHAPHDSSIQQLLAEVQLRLGDSESAARTLLSLTKQYPDDPQILGLLGEAYMAQHQYREASSALERAAALTPDNENVRKQLALSRIGYGETDVAMADLKALLDRPTASTSTGILLTTLQLKRGEVTEALATVSRLQEVHPDNPVVQNLLGAVLLAIPDRAAARKAFEAAVAVEPTFVAALFNLGQMGLDAGDLAEAESRFKEIIALDPRSASALQGLADIASARGDDIAAVKALERAIAADPTDRRAYVRLVDLHLAAGRPNDAERVVDTMTQNHFGSFEAHELTARTKLALGRHDDAILNYRRAKDAAGYVADDLLRLAREQVALQDFDGARATLVKATNSDRPDDAHAALVRLDILLGMLEAAAVRAAEIRDRKPSQALGHLLIGEVRMAQGDYEAAIAAYREATAVGSGADPVVGLANALFVSGRHDDSLETLAAWLAENPSNLYVEREYALRLVMLNRLAPAQAVLERLNQQVPNDALTLTTLARCYQLNKDPRAREAAESAYAIRPDWPVAADTLGWILVTEGDTVEGLKLLRDAFARDKNPLTRFHIANALNALGRRAEARKELDAILKSNAQLPWIASVQTLYDELR